MKKVIGVIGHAGIGSTCADIIERERRDLKFTAVLAKNHIARQLKDAIHSGESISVSVIEECLYQIEEYIGTGNQPSVEDIINSKQSI